MNAPMTVDRALMLAGDLLRELAEQIGDEQAVNQTMSQWANRVGHGDFGAVCMAAVRTTFVDCLTLTPLEQIPAGSTTFDKDAA